MLKVSCKHQLKAVPKMDFELQYFDLMSQSLKYNEVLLSLKGKNLSHDKHLDSCYNPFCLWKTHNKTHRDIFPGVPQELEMTCTSQYFGNCSWQRDKFENFGKEKIGALVTFFSMSSNFFQFQMSMPEPLFNPQ